MNGDMVKRKLVLEDGSVYLGDGFGAFTDKPVELVFNTSMVGYQEIVSDPSSQTEKPRRPSLERRQQPLTQ